MTGLFPELPAQVSIQRQIEAADREVSFRMRVYDRRVSLGQMTRKKADEELICMRAIAETLRRVKAQQDARQ